MRLEIMRRPDPLHRAQSDARVFGHRPASPLRRLAGRLGAGERYDPMHGLIAQRLLAGLAGGIAQQTVDPGLGEPPLPTPDRRSADPGAPRDLGDIQSVGRAEDDPSPRDVLLARLRSATIAAKPARSSAETNGHTI
jgi:hypothetical protein